MKTLYLFRHGDYEQERDHENYAHLTEQGIQQLTRAGERIKEELSGIEEIAVYHSPRVRAKESAEVLAEALSPINTYLEMREKLTCEFDSIKELVDEIAEDDSVDTAILIGHAPDLGRYFWRNLDQRIRFSTGRYKKISLDQENKPEIID